MLPHPSLLWNLRLRSATVTLGANSLKGIAATVPVNGLVPSDLFAAVGGQDPAGTISGAEPEKVAIIDGKAYLDVSVCTNGDVTATTEGWEKAKIESVALDEESGTAILTVPAAAVTGFMILKSKAAVSDVDVWLRENPDGQDDEEFYGPHIE